MDLNDEDGGNRRFIVVQLPEPLPQPGVLKDGTNLQTIADIGVQRVVRVILRLRKRSREQLDLQPGIKQDLGFKYFRLRPSNFQSWVAEDPDTSPADYSVQLELLADPLISGWTPINVIHELSVKEGLSLTSSINAEDVNGVRAWSIVDKDKGQSIRICLVDALSLDVVRALSLTRDDLFVCRDVALDDTAAANLALQCHLKTI
ncbi:MAG: hypothetical protein ACR2JC_03605 [Chloroflexota bacterium]|nr:MAG: hypothetical protein DLM70_18405 [Chloroflexota bacterium]